MTDSAVQDALRAVLPLAYTTKHQSERERRLALPLVAALRDANLFRLFVPRADGGLEASPLEALHAIETLASVDAAAAWIVWNSLLPAWMSRFLAADVRAELFGDAAHILASSTRPTGHAQRERDGYRVSGQWALVSGCELADHVLLRVNVAPSEATMLYLDRSSYRVVDTWHSGGLRGTGSHDVVVEDAWVPAARSVWFDRPHSLMAPLYRMPFAATLSAGCASLCLGIARAALAALQELARTKLSTDRGLALRDEPQLLRGLARMQAALDAARLLLLDAVAAAWSCSQAGEPVDASARANMLAAAQHAAVSAKHSVRSAYELAGATALYEACPIERAHRDIHAATQHVILQDFWLDDVGRVALGALPQIPLFGL